MRLQTFVMSMLVTLLLSTGCATTGRVAADLALSPKQENELGKEMSVEVEKDLKVLDNRAINVWIHQMGQKIAAAAKPDIPKGIQFTFKVIDDDATVNAFAMPGGYIYIYTGLLKKASNEAEIAAVMGHEIAHVTQRHIARRLTTTYGVSALASVALGNNPGLLREIVTGVAANGYLLKHSRDAERESDTEGMKYIIQAGYSPMGYATFFQKLAGPGAPPAILSTHPNPSERVANANKATAKLSQSIRSRDRGEAAYRQQMSALK